MPLNPKQQRFVAEYLKDSNATQAAIRAGYAPICADVTGCRLLKHASVAAELAKVVHENAKVAGLTPEIVLQKVVRLGDMCATPPIEGKFDNTWHPTAAMKSYEMQGRYLGIKGFDNAPAIAVNTGIAIHIHLEGDKDNG